MLLLLRWWLRSTKRHGKRVLALIDAKAILFAVAKGRTSSRTLRPILRSIGAHVLGGNLLVYPLYVPSEDNPADAPSRNIKRRRGVPRFEAQRVRKRHVKSRCPGCGVDAKNHPLSSRRCDRGKGHMCCHGFASRNSTWASHADLWCERVRTLPQRHPLRKAAEARGLLDPYEDSE